MRPHTRTLLSLVTLIVSAPLALAEEPRFGLAEAEPRTEGAIRLATYNLENLFDDEDNPELTGRNDDMDSVKPDDEKQALADAIRAIDADILALQEVESYDALIEFRDEYIGDMGYEHVVSIDVGQERGIENAVLSRFPLKDPKVWPNLPLGGVHPDLYGDKPNWYAGEPITFRRSPLRVTVEVPSDKTGAEPYELTLFVVHHKSGRYNDYWREKEASKLVEFITEMQTANPERNIAVLGDFNAMIGEESVEVYLDEAGFSDVFEGTDHAPKEYVSHASGRRIDFILVNEALEDEVVEGSEFVLGTPQLPPGADWRTTPPPPGYASDHMPVVIDLIPRDRSNE